MDATELDMALEELEIRLERLRSLYEQYFLGIEKIEPAIARKDVDRRIWLLRREKIRNTAKRFKLQTIIQRYNTFQQYWQRICREIENGTYKRHVLRAQRIAPEQLLTIAARRRLGRPSSSIPPAPEDETPTQALPSAPPLPTAPSTSSAPPPSAPAAARPSSSPPSRPPALRPISAQPLPPRPMSSFPPKPRAPTQRPNAQARQPQQYESLDFDLSFLGDWDPGSAKPSPSPRSKPQHEKPAAPAPTPQLKPPPPMPRRAEPPPVVVAAPPAAAAPAPQPPPQPAAPAPEPPPQPARNRPAPARPAPPASSPTASSPGLTDDRLRELHARLLEAKRNTKDPTMVTMEGLAKSLKATEEKLKQQHKNRRIDFDIIIKDGKAVVKPIVR